MKLETFRCDVCGNMWDSTQSWFLCGKSCDGRGVEFESFSIFPWDYNLASLWGHLCSRACCKKMMDKKIDTW